MQPVREADAGGKIWRLLKPMYGLGDSSRNWFLTISDALVKLGCRKIDTDHAMFYHNVGGSLNGIVSMHVDDLCLLPMI